MYAAPDTTILAPTPDLSHLPERVRRLLNPAVMSRRAEVVHRRVSDEGANAVRLRRCAEIITNNLLENVNDILDDA